MLTHTDPRYVRVDSFWSLSSIGKGITMNPYDRAIEILEETVHIHNLR